MRPRNGTSWSAAILAGGQARRLGGLNKGTLDIGGLSIIDRQLSALAALTDDIALIGGPAPHPQAPAVRVISDRRPGAGALGGLYTALAAAVTDRVLVLAGDMPFITAPFLSFLLEVDEGAAAVVPDAGGRWHPLCAVYSRRVADAIGAALDRGEQRVTDVVATLSARVVPPAALAPYDPDGRLLMNVNTPADYARAMQFVDRPPRIVPHASDPVKPSSR